MLKKLLKKLVGSHEPEASQTPVIPAAPPEKNFKNLRVKMSRPSKHRRFRFSSFLMRRGVQVSIERRQRAGRLRGIAFSQRQTPNGAAPGCRPDSFFKTSRVLLAAAAVPPAIFNASVTVQKIPGSGKGRHAWGRRLSNKRGNSAGG